jgi:hypothetical protein
MVEKRTIFLELPCEMIEKIDTWNPKGDRSLFVTELLEKQLQNENSKTDIAEMETKMNAFEKSSDASGEISLVDGRGIVLGRFDINAVEGIEKLSEKICELSDDPVVRMRVRLWR